MTSKSQLVNASCLDGLEVLREHDMVFLATPAHDIFADHSYGNGELVEGQNDANANDESKETRSSKEFVSWWSNKVGFDDDGFVVSLDLGGRRLHKGLPFGADLFGTRKFPRLQTLSLAGTDLPLKDILAVLPHIESTIECLYLGGNGLGARGAEAIAASGLFRWSSDGSDDGSKLVKLDLRYNDIGGSGMTAICKAVMETTNSNIRYLYLEGNGIGDDGCAALAGLLSARPQSDEESTTSTGGSRIEEVYLGANRIGPPGAASIAAVLRTNKTVSKIYLEGNSLGAKGATSFCEMLEELKGDTGLKHLYVDNNNIGKELSNRLAKALRSDTAIRDVGAGTTAHDS
mmetsp:Transcript_18896/g.43218  ORF Transcript_18896/g.43218 Transcript_18896/m.43218 type:complete len:346 (-) Transcript_18896:247-1284(-)